MDKETKAFIQALDSATKTGYLIWHGKLPKGVCDLFI